MGLEPATPDKDGERAKRITSGAGNSIARPQSSQEREERRELTQRERGRGRGTEMVWGRGRQSEWEGGHR